MMSKNRDKGNIIFFVGVLIFVVSLVVGFVTDISAVLIDTFMGIGLVIEFVGLCVCYKKDKKEVMVKKEDVTSLNEVKVREENIDDIVEVVKEEKKATAKKTNTKKKQTTSTTENGVSGKKTTTKKTNAKKTNTKKNK